MLWLACFDLASFSLSDADPVRLPSIAEHGGSLGRTILKNTNPVARCVWVL